jgi:hypothetical protein
MPNDDECFVASRARFEGILAFLGSQEASTLSHSELESRLAADGWELLRQLYQDHLDLRACREERIEEVIGADGVCRRYAEADHDRPLTTVFGQVRVRRLAYRKKGASNLHPADGVLNLPEETYSHGLRRLVAIEASRGSFDETISAVDRASGAHVPKRQAEALTTAAAVDFDDFYARRAPEPAGPDDAVVVSVDGKGIVMLPQALREATAKAAARATAKLATRLSKGEKANRKRVATVGSVYDLTPVPRTPADILPAPEWAPDPPPQAPVATNKWLTASVVADAATVVARVFDEASRRDQQRRRRWVALVDGNNHQIDRIRAEADVRGIDVAIVVDFVHVLEYLWSAAWCFFAEGDPGAEAWVREKARAILEGKAPVVAAAIRRTATNRRLSKAQRANADTCADYLLRKQAYLNYPTALARGWPIATGVIEGACRHLVKDRMDLTGARWGLEGAEAVLRLRALRSNGDFDEYWSFHLARERQRVHESRYLDGRMPVAG